MLQITDTITIQDWELTEQFIRASGPGGQNVNKTSSAVELRFEAARSPNIPAHIKPRLQKLAGQKWTKEGAIVIQVDTTRSQAQNRELARDRLRELIQKSLTRPKRRIPTKPTRGSVERRIQAKKALSEKKQNRKIVDE